MYGVLINFLIWTTQKILLIFSTLKAAKSKPVRGQQYSDTSPYEESIGCTCDVVKELSRPCRLELESFMFGASLKTVIMDHFKTNAKWYICTSQRLSNFSVIQSLKMGQSRRLLCLFLSFPNDTIQI